MTNQNTKKHTYMYLKFKNILHLLIIIIQIIYNPYYLLISITYDYSYVSTKIIIYYGVILGFDTVMLNMKSSGTHTLTLNDNFTWALEEVVAQ